ERGAISREEGGAVPAKSLLKGKYDARVVPFRVLKILRRRPPGAAVPPIAGATPGSAPASQGPSGSGAPSPPETGLFHRIGEKFRSLFGIGRPRGTRLTTSQSMARNVVRAVAAGMATQVAAELAKSTGSKTAGTV